MKVVSDVNPPTRIRDRGAANLQLQRVVAASISTMVVAFRCYSTCNSSPRFSECGVEGSCLSLGADAPLPIRCLRINYDITSKSTWNKGHLNIFFPDPGLLSLDHVTISYGFHDFKKGTKILLQSCLILQCVTRK